VNPSPVLCKIGESKGDCLSSVLLKKAKAAGQKSKCEENGKEHRRHQHNHRVKMMIVMMMMMLPPL